MAKTEEIYASVTVLCSCPSFVKEDLLVFSRNNITITKILGKYRDYGERKFHLNIEYLKDSELPLKLSNTLMELSENAVKHYKVPAPFYALRQIGTGTIVKK